MSLDAFIEEMTIRALHKEDPMKQLFEWVKGGTVNLQEFKLLAQKIKQHEDRRTPYPLAII